MIKVLNRTPSRNVVKEVVCRNCGSTLEYTPRDMIEDYIQDCLGHKDYYKYIPCPECGNGVTVK